MTRTVGRPITTDALAALHRPDHALALSDARDHARRALAALRSIEPTTVNGDTFIGIGRCGATLRDLVDELDRIERRT